MLLFKRVLFTCLAVTSLAANGLAGNDPIEDPELLDSYPKPDTAYYKYLKERRLECLGDLEELKEPEKMKIHGREFFFTGSGLRLEGKDADGIVKLGVLGAVKDFGSETRKALKFYLDRFEKEKVDALLLLGDIAALEFELTQVLLFCAKAEVPVLAVIGNSESRASFNRAVLAALKAAPNIINMDFVRRVDLGGAVVVSLPGYLDRRFVHQSSGCTYEKRDVRKSASLVEGVEKPIVFVSHGPPQGNGPKALDYAVEGGNVGDPLISGFMEKHGIPFGIFSHILEAGGQALDDQGKEVSPEKYVEKLRVNVGSANPLAWQLNSGKLSCGMAMVFRVKNGQASYSLLRYPCK